MQQRRRSSEVCGQCLADLSPADSVLDQVAGWLAEYNGIAPHSAPGFRSPRQYRAEVLKIR